MIAEAIYILCAVTSIVCAVLLLRAYLQTKARLLLWSSLCFAALMLNNLMLFIDKVIFPETDMPNLLIARSVTALVGLLLLMFGLIWDAE